MNGMTSSRTDRKILILGIGNVLMGDEGIGVHAVNSIDKASLPENVEVLDGGTGSFLLIGPMQSAEKVILIDATLDSAEPGTVRRIRPKFSKDYPKTLTAHDIGLKDMIDAFYLMGNTPEVTLFAVSIAPLGEVTLDMSPEIAAIVPSIVKQVLEEVEIS